MSLFLETPIYFGMHKKKKLLSILQYKSLNSSDKQFIFISMLEKHEYFISSEE